MTRAETGRHPDKNMIALGIRQPWAELILQGVKTVEVRTQPTAQRGPIYLYASKKFSEHPAARKAAAEHQIELESLPRGLIVGSVNLVESRLCRSADAAAACVPSRYLKRRHAWILEEPLRFEQPLTVRFLPYGVWFYPWKRRNGSRR